MPELTIPVKSIVDFLYGFLTLVGEEEVSERKKIGPDQILETKVRVNGTLYLVRKDAAEVGFLYLARQLSPIVVFEDSKIIIQCLVVTLTGQTCYRSIELSPC